MIDAETSEPMEGKDIVYEQEIRPQMSLTELIEFEQLLDNAASGGSTITIIELVACLSVKQVLFANWILITSL